MKKTIMFIVPTLCGGGAEKTVANLSKYLIKDYNIEIVLFKDTEMKYSYSGNLTILNNKKNSNLIKKVLFTIKSIFKLRKLKKEKNIDYAISFLTPADALNVFSKVRGTKTIISIRNTDSILMKNFLMKMITYISCKKCDHIISISNQVKDDLINNFDIKEDKITTIYNPSLKIEFGKTKMKLDDDFFENDICINVARLVDQKGQWHLIRAFSKVILTNPKAKLVILGQGPLDGYLENLVNEYNLNENILMLGFVDNPYDYIKKSKCFVFSSLYEGLGNAILESLVCSVPVISCDCISGPREILAPNTNYKNKVKDKIDYAEFGILVPVFDGVKRSAKEKLTMEEEIMADAIIEFFKKDKFIHYKAMAEKRSKDFDITEITKQWIEFLEKEE